MTTMVKRWRNRLGIMIALGLPFVAGGQDGGQDEGFRRRDSLVAILADPEEYDGREVRLVGYVSIKFEMEAIWLAESDFENNVFANAIEFHDEITSMSENGYAEVKGVFHKADPRDHYPGWITPTYVRPWFLSKAAKSAATPPPPRKCSWFF